MREAKFEDANENTTYYVHQEMTTSADSAINIHTLGGTRPHPF